MSARQWTPAQQYAIEDTGGSLLVSAAAGSGKTAVLVERAIRMMTRAENPVAADRLLILTFTNAAADELRSRIGIALEEALAKNSRDSFLRRQRILLRRAFIGTLDAFCQQLVREHFSQLGLPPDIAVGEASLLAGLQQEALAATMEEMYEDADFAAFCALYGRARSDREAEEAILKLYRFTQTLPRPAAALAGFAAMYREDVPLEETAWGKELLGYAGEALAAAAHLSASARHIAATDGDLAPWVPALLEGEGQVAALRERVRETDWDGAERLLRGYAPPRLAPVRGYGGQNKERVKFLRDKGKDIMAELSDYCFVCTSAEFAQDRAEAAPLVGALCRAVELYADTLRKAMLEEKVADFGDFEHLALALLQTEEGGRSEAAGRVSARYDAVMVDEYQDTNELQAALYACLGSEAGDNLFYVGDVKQSIYRFRLANPGIFLEKRHSWAPFAPEGEHPAVLTLGHNFRSGQGVIQGVNFLFSRLMSPRLGEVDYGEEERLIQGGEGGDEEGVELHLLNDPDGLGDAVWVARRIAQMVTGGYEVRDGEGLRPCGYGDFCILLRTRSALPQYLAALEGLGVPAVSDLEDELLDTPEVLPLRAALAAIDNPGDDVNLVAALLGPLFRFSPDEVAALRAQAPASSLWGVLAASREAKVVAFTAQMQYYRTLAAEVSVGRLCEELAGRTGYLSAVAAMEGGLARRENLLRFMGWAAEVSASGRGGLAGFVRLLENGRGPGGGGFKGLAGHVSLLTIHKSKGLEFPVCILADAGHGFNTQDMSQRVQVHADLGVGLWLRRGSSLYPTLPVRAVRRRCEEETLSEEMRVLYVALTRAKDKLIITYPHRDPLRRAAQLCDLAQTGELDPFLLAGGRCLGDWVLSAALLHPGAAALCAEMEREVPPCEDEDPGRLVVALSDALAPQEAERPEYRLTAAPDEGLVRELLASFAARPPRSPLSELPVKVSVSALAKPDLPAIRKRPSFMYKAGLTAAERGTAMHSFLQLADFAAAQNDVEAEVDRLVREGRMAAEEAASLDRGGIAAFFASPLAGRMLGAQRVLREYDFITTVPAAVLDPALPEELAGEAVFVQGIADAVVLRGETAEIVDYKTDRGKSEEALVQLYKQQLRLYRAAIEKRLARPVACLTLWSFSLMREIDVPL